MELWGCGFNALRQITFNPGGSTDDVPDFIKIAEGKHLVVASATWGDIAYIKDGHLYLREQVIRPIKYGTPSSAAESSALSEMGGLAPSHAVLSTVVSNEGVRAICDPETTEIMAIDRIKRAYSIIPPNAFHESNYQTVTHIAANTLSEVVIAGRHNFTYLGPKLKTEWHMLRFKSWDSFVNWYADKHELHDYTYVDGYTSPPTEPKRGRGSPRIIDAAERLDLGEVNAEILSSYSVHKDDNDDDDDDHHDGAHAFKQPARPFIPFEGPPLPTIAPPAPIPRPVGYESRIRAGSLSKTRPQNLDFQQKKFLAATTNRTSSRPMGDQSFLFDEVFPAYDSPSPSPGSQPSPPFPIVLSPLPSPIEERADLNHVNFHADNLIALSPFPVPTDTNTSPAPAPIHGNDRSIKNDIDSVKDDYDSIKDEHNSANHLIKMEDDAPHFPADQDISSSHSSIDDQEHSSGTRSPSESSSVEVNKSSPFRSRYSSLASLPSNQHSPPRSPDQSVSSLPATMDLNGLREDMEKRKVYEANTVDTYSKWRVPKPENVLDGRKRLLADYNNRSELETPLRQLIASATSFAALTIHGKIYTWGDKRHPEVLGRTTDTPANAAKFPFLMSGTTGQFVTKITSCVNSFMMGCVTVEGDAYLWGKAKVIGSVLSEKEGDEAEAEEKVGGLAILDNIDHFFKIAPIKLPLLEGEKEEASVVDLAVGDGHLLVLDGRGRVWSAGDNSHGQLGLGEESVGDYQRDLRVVKSLEGKKVKSVHCGDLTSYVVFA